MPSPTCPIPLTFIGSEWIEPLEGEEGRLYLKKSIPIGESITLDGVAKAKIRRLDRPFKSNKALLEKHTISLKATMPWLNRELPLLTFNRSIDIQYPLELVEFRILPTLTPASKNKLTVKVGQLFPPKPLMPIENCRLENFYKLLYWLLYSDILLELL
jgi:hypothetical protein